ncbi:MAG: DUF4430 domain-containing protein [Clostridia bacterium]|nr:DUF4430 domain-containing protein [Clostridia bacterium]
MKKSILLTLVAIFVILSFASCKTVPEGLWDDAMYTEDTSLGEGAKTFTLKITAEEYSVTLTVSSDMDTLGDALAEHSLMDGTLGDYGLYVTEVNGMTLVYETHGMYWAIYENGEYALSGVDGINIKDGGEYEFKAEK